MGAENSVYYNRVFTITSFTINGKDCISVHIVLDLQFNLRSDYNLCLNFRMSLVYYRAH